MAKRKTDVFWPDRVEGGKLVTRPVLQILRELEGAQVEVCIRPRRNYTTLNQHRYYRGCVIHLLADAMRDHGVTGRWGGPITDDEAHQMMAAMFLKVTVILDAETGECADIPLSTADATTAQMSQFVDSVKLFARERYGLEIPEAGEQLAFV